MRSIPHEMIDRHVVVFDGLRTPEGRAIATGFLDEFDACPLRANANVLQEFLGGPPEWYDVPYTERVRSTASSLRCQQMVHDVLSPLADGGDLTPHKVLVIADIIQLCDVVARASSLVYALLPDVYKSDEVAQEDWGSVSQVRSFDVVQLYRRSYVGGVWEWLDFSVDPVAHRHYIATVLEAGKDPSRWTIVTTHELAERCVAAPLEMIQALIEISGFVRDSNAATWATIIEHYAPRLHKQSLDAEAARLSGDAIANARAAAAKTIRSS